ncbi:unnamed protein product [Pylaiella littoralis]
MCRSIPEAAKMPKDRKKDAPSAAAAAAGAGSPTTAVVVVADAQRPSVSASAKSEKHHPPATYQMRALLEITLPVLITNLSQAALPLTSFAYAGRLTDAVSLAGLGLGISVCNITGVCIYYGMGTGIELLCAQAFGAKNNRLVGLAFARGTLLTTFAFIPVGFLWFYMESVLLAVGQQPNVAHITGTFSRAYLWGMIPYAVFENLKRCLQAQSVVAPIMVVTLFGVLANVIFHHLTMVIFGMGVYGAGLALALTGMFLLTILIAYTWAFSLGAEGCWTGLWSWEVFQRWPGYIVLCIPGLTGVLVEWTSVEASTVLAGLLGEEELATQIMILSAYGIAFQFALSIGIAVNIRVGNFLGAGDPTEARRAAVCGVRLALVAAALAVLGLGLGRSQWPRLYGVHGDVLDRIIHLAPVYVVAQMIDMTQFVCTGILKGMGYQRLQAIAAGVGFWVVGVPLSAYLGVYKAWGLKGLWGSMATAEGPLLIFYLLVLRSADWDDCAVRAAARVQDHFTLVETAPSSPRNVSDSDNDPDSCSSRGGRKGPVSVIPWWGRGDEDEEEGFGHYGGGGRGTALSTGKPKGLGRVGESSKLKAAGPLLPRPRQ